MKIHKLKGKDLETTVLASQLGNICVAKIPSGMRYTGGGEKIETPGGRSRFIPRAVAMQSPCDFMGCVCGSGRAVLFDAKQCALVKGFRISDYDHFPQHQRDFIQRMGRAGAIAGVLVEATEIEEFLWLDWEYLSPHNHCPWPVVPWEEMVWRRLGDSSRAIRFDLLTTTLFRTWKDGALHET